MFKPNFTITNTTTRYLSEIAVAREIVLRAPLIPKWEIDLRRQSLINSTHASTSIEGNKLSLEEISDLMIGREITATRRDKQEVINYFEALNYLDILASKKELASEDILKLHKIITKGVLDDPKNSGHYRTPADEKKRGRVVVAERLTRKITFLPPPAKEVPEQIKKFIAWLNNKEARELDPVLEAGVTHYEFVRIHPFIDGNGRTSRVLASLILLRRGFDTKRFFALDDFYNSDRPRYYEALKSVNPQTLDLTAWLEYFCEGVAVSINAVRDKVLSLTGDKKKDRETEQVALDNRQIKVVEFLRKEGKITNKQIRGLLKTSNKTAYELLQSLIKNRVITKEGKGRNTHYLLG
ncbi:Fic family protein [Candidatus Nomurabacteria bacterium]|nr:Fic family protein [Candidatus Nomurabacteria bacterium]